MITDVYKKRVQTFIFNNDVPEKELINSLLEKTYELVPSKQNIIPYKVVVWGPEYDKKELRRSLSDVFNVYSKNNTPSI